MEVEWYGVILTVVLCILVFQGAWANARKVFQARGLPDPKDTLERWAGRYNILLYLLFSFVALYLCVLLYCVEDGTVRDLKDIMLKLVFCRDRAMVERRIDPVMYIWRAAIYIGPVYTVTYYLRLRHLRETQPQAPSEQRTEETFLR